MSTSTSHPNKMKKNSFHWRNDSGELDVFEAARYFSSGADHPYIRGVRGDKHQAARPARRSLDVPILMRSHPIPPEYDQKQMTKDQNKKFKQPSSPGGRLASFLNSLFSQTPLKKKKKPKSGSGGKEFEEESPNGRRKRRSSISHFRITTTSKTAAAAVEKGGCGYRTSPPYAITPTKSYKELARFVDQHAASMTEKKGVDSEKIVGKMRSSEQKKELRKWKEENDGWESDSSSDLFDLPNHDLDFFSLPVYETTHIPRITIPTPT